MRLTMVASLLFLLLAGITRHWLQDPSSGFWLLGLAIYLAVAANWRTKKSD